MRQKGDVNECVAQVRTTFAHGGRSSNAPRSAPRDASEGSFCREGLSRGKDRTTRANVTDNELLRHELCPLLRTVEKGRFRSNRLTEWVL